MSTKRQISIGLPPLLVQGCGCSQKGVFWLMKEAILTFIKSLFCRQNKTTSTNIYIHMDKIEVNVFSK